MVGDWILKHGGENEARLLIMVMVGAAVLGSVMSSTAVVALFIPIVLRIAAETRLNASRMLIPLSYASLISGMMTLIATTPNIIVHEELKSAGFEGFSFFSFSPVGVAVLVVAIGYVLLVGRRLLGNKLDRAIQRRTARSMMDQWQEHSPGSTYRKLRIDADCPLEGLALSEARLESQYRIRVVGVLRHKRKGVERIVAPAPATELTTGTTLLVVGKPEAIDRMAGDNNLVAEPPNQSDQQRWLWDISSAVILIHPDSQLLNKSLRECQFRSSYGVHVLGLRRNFRAVEDFEDIRLQPADSLYVVGSWHKIQQLTQRSDDFVVTEFPREHADVVPSYQHLPKSLAILAGLILLTVTNIVPLVAAVMIASLAAVATRCLTMEQAYRSIHWSSLVLIAGMLPLAEALQQTGGMELVADALISVAGDAGPYMVLSLVFFLTAAIGLVLSNATAAVLVSPIAIYTASILDLSPYPFAVAVVIAASSSFSTPVATPVVTLVVEPGRYRFGDFLKTGLPLLFLVYLTTLMVAPLVFPFHPGA